MILVPLFDLKFLRRTSSIWCRNFKSAALVCSEEARSMATIPTQMNCIGIPKPGGPEALVMEKRSVPSPAKGEVLVKVAAAGVNRPDVVQRRGFYPPPPGASDVPGLEIAGEVVALGEAATRFKIGDTVMAL